MAGGESLVDAADAFLGSAEFVAKHPLLTDQDFINLVFSGVFSRTATPSEAAGWLSAMGSGTLTRGAMVVDLVQSADGRGATGPLSRVIAAETAADLSAGAIAARVSQAEEGAPPTTDDLAKGLSSLQNGVSAMALANNLSQTVEGVQARQLRGIYEGLLNRAADAAGLSRWLAAVQAGMGLAQAAEGFLLSGEYQGNSGHRNLDNESFVKSLYQGFFAGQYDPVAGNAAIAGLDAGTLSRGQVVVQILSAAQAHAATVGLNRQVAMDTARAMGMVPVAVGNLALQAAPAGTPVTFSLPQGLFSDSFPGDSLATSVSLPSWLSFDPTRQVYVGTPDDTVTGVHEVVVTTYNQVGLSAGTTVYLSVAAGYHTPTVDSGVSAQLARQLAGQVATAGAAWRFSLPGGLFAEDIQGDSLSISGTSLSWLSFDPVSQTFSGTPGDLVSGPQTVVVTATDQGGKSLSDTLSLMVMPGYHTPTVNLPASAQLAQELATQGPTAGAAWRFSLPAGLFAEDIQGDSLSISGTSLSWVSFDPVTQTYSGTADDLGTGRQSVVVTASDHVGKSLSDTLFLTVAAGYHTPTVDTGLSAQLAQELATQGPTAGTAWSFSLPSALFAEDIPGDTLSISGTSLYWLSFDPVTQVYSGTADDLGLGRQSLVVTATDQGGKSISDTLFLTVAAGYRAPTVNSALSAQVVQEMGSQVATAGTSWSFTLPSGLFSEAIAGDTIAYWASLAFGSQLPTWLAFDPSRSVFTANPPDGIPGEQTFQLWAGDMQDHATGMTLSLSVMPGYHTPTVNLGISAQLVQQLATQGPTGGTAWSFSLPSGLFAEDSDTLFLTVAAVYHTPTVNLQASAQLAQELATQWASAGTAWSFSLPAGLFAEDIQGDSWGISGTSLYWLSFDPVTQVYSGTPDDRGTGPQSVVVTATDQVGKSVSDTLFLTVAAVYHTPTVDAGLSAQLAQELATQMASAGTAWSFSLPLGLFAEDIPGDSLSITGTSLYWLSFDPVTQIYSGTPDDRGTGGQSVVVTATDQGAKSLSDTLFLTVAAVYHTPTVDPGLSAQLAQELATQGPTAGTAWSFTLPAGLFVEDITGDTLSFSGTSLYWLSFDPVTQVYSGTADDLGTGPQSVVVTASDQVGNAVSDTLFLTVAAGYHTPTVNMMVSAQLAQEASTLMVTSATQWSFSLPAGLFSEDIAGDTLVYSATLGDSVLPAWLAIDSTTGNLSGTVPNILGTLPITVIATDGDGLSASVAFAPSIANGYAPIVQHNQEFYLYAAAGGNPSVTFGFSVPYDNINIGDVAAGLFAPPVSGESMTYNAVGCIITPDGEQLASYESAISLGHWIPPIQIDPMTGDANFYAANSGVNDMYIVQITASTPEGYSATASLYVAAIPGMSNYWYGYTPPPANLFTNPNPQIPTPGSSVRAPAAPPAPTGLAAADNIDSLQAGFTHVTQPHVVGSGVVPGADVLLFEGGLLLGRSVADANGAYAVKPSNPLAAGLHSLSVVQAVNGRFSAASPSLHFGVTNFDVAWEGGAAQPNAYMRGLALDFNDPMAVIGPMSASSGGTPTDVHFDPTNFERLIFDWQTPASGPAYITGTMTDASGHLGQFFLKANL